MKLRICRCLQAAVAVVLCLPSAGDTPLFALVPGGVRNDAWRIIGMGGGGTIRLIQASPINPDLALATSDMSGSYITRDGGKSWRSFYLLEGVSSFAFDPVNAEVLYALNNALWRSDNGGKTWKMIFPAPETVTRLNYVSSDADCMLQSRDPAFQEWRALQRLAVNPANPRELYAIAGSSRLGHSTDGGRTWTKIQEFPCAIVDMDFQANAQHPDQSLLVVGKDRLLVGQDRFLPPPPGTTGIVAATIGIEKKSGVRWLYVTTPIHLQEGKLTGGIYLSRNDGKDWEDLTPALLRLGRFAPDEKKWCHTPALRAAACCGKDAQTVFLGFQGLRRGEGEANVFNGIARSFDGGKKWEVVNAEGDRPSTNMTISYVEERAPTGGQNVWFDAPWSLSVPAANGQTCYASDCFRVYRTGDGGATWQQANSAPRGQDFWETCGIDVTTCYGVHWDPFDAKHLFITYTDMGLQQSFDGGESWTTASLGVPEYWRNTAYWVAFDPAVKGLMWSASSATHDLPHPRMWRKAGTAWFSGGVCVSTNGGTSWSVAGKGLPPMATTHILLDPQSPVGARILYACGFARGVYKSADNGATWTCKNDGIEQKNPFAWRLTRDPKGTLYLVIARGSERGEIGDSRDGALYKSTDGAEHWTKMLLPDNCNGPTELNVDPRDPKRLYLTLWGRYAPTGDIGGGIYLSMDGGASWKPILTCDQHVYSLTIDPKIPDRLFACGFEGSAYRSDDVGRHWRRLQGFNFKPGHRISIDPTNADRIYITTFGNSVWMGPADGDPRAPEDIETPLPPRMDTK